MPPSELSPPSLYELFTGIDAANAFDPAWVAKCSQKTSSQRMEGVGLYCLADDDPRHKVPDRLTSVACLSLTRFVALQAGVLCRDSPILPYARDWALRWLNFLLEDPSRRGNWYLQAIRKEDKSLYDAEGCPVGRGKSNFWKYKDDPANLEVLGWLHHPERLSSTELELALVVFKWHTPEAQLNEWLARWPAALWRVHLFLLQRYCFDLLAPLRRARRATPILRATRHRAGVFADRFPRLAGLTLLGLMGLLTWDRVLELFFRGPASLVLVLSAMAVIVLVTLFAMDVHKQNRGALISRDVVGRRVGRLFAYASGWSAALTLETATVWYFSAANPQQAWPLETMAGSLGTLPRYGTATWMLHAVPGLVALATWSSALGALLQWFWEEKSAVEPI